MTDWVIIFFVVIFSLMIVSSEAERDTTATAWEEMTRAITEDFGFMVETNPINIEPNLTNIDSLVRELTKEWK